MNEESITDWWVRQGQLRSDVIAAARAYADFTHGNIRGDRYRRRQEARDALQDALEALDDAELTRSAAGRDII